MGFEVKGKGTYDLLQFHFHTPSEHALNGYRTSMEAHLVHRNRATGTLGVVGVLLSGIQGDNRVGLTKPDIYGNSR
jgi:carbonic anhydrase